MINSAFDLAIEIITSFLDGPLVIILILGFLLPTPLFFVFNIFPTLSADKEGNTSLTHKTSSMLDEIFDFEACTQDFLVFKGFRAFLTTDSMFLLEGEATGKFVVGGRGTAIEGREIIGFKIVDFPFEFTELDVNDSCFL